MIEKTSRTYSMKPFIKKLLDYNSHITVITPVHRFDLTKQVSALYNNLNKFKENINSNLFEKYTD